MFNVKLYEIQGFLLRINANTQKEWFLTCISTQTWLFWVQSGPLLVLITGFCRCPHTCISSSNFPLFSSHFSLQNQMTHRKMSDPPEKNHHQGPSGAAPPPRSSSRSQQSTATRTQHPRNVRPRALVVGWSGVPG